MRSLFFLSFFFFSSRRRHTRFKCDWSSDVCSSDLVSNGIITTGSTLQNEPGVVRGFVQATIMGLKDVIANPAAAVQISKNYIQGINVDSAMSGLTATIPLRQGDGPTAVGHNHSRAR